MIALAFDLLALATILALAILAGHALYLRRSPGAPNPDTEGENQ